MILLPHALTSAFATAIGLVIGSFLNVCIVRLPEDRSVVWPGSHCDVCGKPVRPYDNIPVVSWVLLRGRCRDCGAPIAPVYPLIELLGGLLAWLAWQRFVPDAASTDAAHVAAWITWYGFLAMLVVAAMVDLRHRIIPDPTSVYAVPVAIAAVAVTGALGYDGWPYVGWKAAVLGAAIGGGFLAVTALVAQVVLRREGLGWGDVKLMAAIGAFVGAAPGAFMVLLFGSIFGSVFGLAHALWTWRRTYVPFGPSLALAAGIWILYGDVLLQALLPGITFSAP